MNAATDAPAALVSDAPAEDEIFEIDARKAREREVYWLAYELGYPRMSVIDVFGGGALWGYAITGASEARLVQLKAALESWKAGDRSWDVPEVKCPACAGRGYLGHRQCDECGGRGRLVPAQK